MRHKTALRWISDDLDRALPAERKRRLETHLAACSACRVYQNTQRKILAGAVIGKPSCSDEYWRERLVRLRNGLESTVPRPVATRNPARSIPGFFPWKSWIWGGSLTALGVAVVLFFLWTPIRPLQDVYAYSIDDPWSVIDQQIGADESTVREFNDSLLASLAEPLDETLAEVVLLLDDQAQFLDNLSDEDIRLFNSEIAREIVI